jgi:hypothetical protein
LRAINASMLPHLDVEDQEEALIEWQVRAGYRKAGVGGYRDNVIPISLEDFRNEIRRGVNG